MSIGDRMSGVFWLLISLGIAFESYRLGIGELRSPRAGFLPFVASMLLGVLSVILLFSAAHRKREAIENHEDIAFNKGLMPKVLCALGSLFLYSIFLDVLGFLLVSVILMAYLLWAIEPQKWYVVTLGAILMPAIAYLLFGSFLGVQLPKGILGF